MSLRAEQSVLDSRKRNGSRWHVKINLSGMVEHGARRIPDVIAKNICAYVAFQCLNITLENSVKNFPMNSLTIQLWYPHRHTST